ncbi:MAG: hypothetical protein LZF86_190077 [Nitrospira sp.]|nr:MAG: hypothetical protein LZF86_190077 [Nitrospira sp.]
MGTGLVRLRLLRLHDRKKSAWADKRPLPECPRWIVEKQSDHAPHCHSQRLAPGTRLSDNRFSLREIDTGTGARFQVANIRSLGGAPLTC